MARLTIFSPRARRFLRAAVETIKPRWDDFDPPVEDRLVAKIEQDLSAFPRFHILGIKLILFLIQWSGPLLLRGLRPFTALSAEERDARMRLFSESDSATMRYLARAVVSVVVINYYALPEVQRYLGVERDVWVRDRIALRERLLAAHPPGPEAPPPPAALGSAGVVTPERYLTPADEEDQP